VVTLRTLDRVLFRTHVIFRKSGDADSDSDSKAEAASQIYLNLISPVSGERPPRPQERNKFTLLLVLRFGANYLPHAIPGLNRRKRTNKEDWKDVVQYRTADADLIFALDLAARARSATQRLLP